MANSMATYSLDQESLARLEFLAAHLGMRKSELIRMLIGQEYVRRYGENDLTPSPFPEGKGSSALVGGEAL